MGKQKSYDDLSLSLGEGVKDLLDRDEELQLIRIAQKGFREVDELGVKAFGDKKFGKAIITRIKEKAKEGGVLNKKEAKILATVLEGERARNVLIERNLRLVSSIAKCHIRKSVMFKLDDLINEGALGFAHAIELFSEEEGCRLSTYASLWIRQAIQRALGSNGRTIAIPIKKASDAYRYAAIKRRPEQPSRQEIAEEMGLTLEEVKELERVRLSGMSLEMMVNDEKDQSLSKFLVDQKSQEPDVAYELEALPKMLEEAFTILKQREIDIISMRFGLNGHVPHTLQEIANKMERTRENVRQRLEYILAKLGRSKLINQYRPVEVV